MTKDLGVTAVVGVAKVATTTSPLGGRHGLGAGGAASVSRRPSPSPAARPRCPGGIMPARRARSARAASSPRAPPACPQPAARAP